MLRWLLIIIGSIFVALGIIGIFLPIVPTTPFLLVAAACYAKSSTRLYNWLLNNRYFGSYIKNWREGRGVPWRTKIYALSLMVLTIGYSVIFVVPIFFVKVLLVIIALLVGRHIYFLPTLKINKEVSS